MLRGPLSRVTLTKGTPDCRRGAAERESPVKGKAVKVKKQEKQPHTKAITFDEWLRQMPNVARGHEFGEERGKATITLKLTMLVEDWLDIAQGAAINECSLEEAIIYLINDSDYPTEWKNQDYKMAEEKSAFDDDDRDKPAARN